MAYNNRHILNINGILLMVETRLPNPGEVFLFNKHNNNTFHLCTNYTNNFNIEGSYFTYVEISCANLPYYLTNGEKQYFSTGFNSSFRLKDKIDTPYIHVIISKL